MSETTRIRPMAREDLDAVLAIAAGLKNAPQWDRRAYEGAILQAQARDRVALVAEGAQSSIAGFLVAVLIPPEAELESIAVDAASQRRGIARQLFAALVQELRARCVDILLEVRPSNQAGRAFYAALGFVETARRPAYYADPVEDAILMRLAIPAKPPDWLQMPHSS